MFNTTHNHRTNYVPYEKSVNVKEYKAPTDEALKMLQDMQEKAEGSIINKIDVIDNVINFVAIFFAKDIIYDSVTLHLKFTINSKEFIFKENIARRDYIKIYSDYHHSRRDLTEKVCRLIAEDLTKHLMQEVNVIYQIEEKLK